MDIRQRQEGAVAIVTLDGRLTVNDRPGLLREAVAEVVRSGTTQVLLDLSGVNYIDSTRLGELISAHVTVSKQGGRLKLAGAPPRIVELLAIAGLASVFDRYATADEALKSFN